jgi:hypothetical protein
MHTKKKNHATGSPRPNKFKDDSTQEKQRKKTSKEEAIKSESTSLTTWIVSIERLDVKLTCMIWNMPGGVRERLSLHLNVRHYFRNTTRVLQYTLITPSHNQRHQHRGRQPITNADRNRGGCAHICSSSAINTT